MSDDLLRRLKEQHHNTNVLDGDTMREAAEEITRFRSENEKLRRAMHDIYEVYAGSEGIPEPVGCAEAYLLKLLMDMVEIAAEHKHIAAAIREGGE